ncbi:hypothetical protein HPB48_005310 [Haemaphysalis longicornis]|uniref:Kazal-like domain-containing protein n=1 Tax=Haemaphysalis longicornis TaxID=44386 RepID=A0A9J6GGY1_HAELO|nr:hypothetical protein HPB48_005310 [Haemaphysalis longicornis]
MSCSFSCSAYEQCQMVRRLHGSFKGDDVQYGQYVSDIPKAVLSLLKNVTFVLLILSSATEAMIGTAVMAFSVKFFEAEFALTPSATAATLGSILIPAGVGGTLLGGALTTKLDMKVRSMLKMCYAIGIVPWLCMWTFVLYCPTAQLFQGDARSSKCDRVTRTGERKPRPRTAGRTINFIGKCNENCQCRTDLFDPICSVDNVTYMSPCYAGCAASSIPAPLILGSVIDSSCLVWQEVCLERGACIFYNNEQLAHSMLLFLVPAKTASIALCYAANATLRERYANL